MTAEGDEARATISAFRLAELAGAPVGFVERAAELGIVREGKGGQAFRPTDVGRVRLAMACDRAGLPLDAIGKAVAEGRLSFAFMDLPQYGFAGFTGATYQQVADERGIPVEFLRRLHEAQGFARPETTDVVREDDLPLIGALQVALLFGMPEEPVVRMMRVYGESLRRVAEGENAAYRENVEAPLLAGGMDVGSMMETSSAFGAQYMQVMDQALLALYHRQQEHVWISNMVERIEQALEDMGLVERLERPPAMCFLDLVGYTRLTEERGDAAAAELAAALAGADGVRFEDVGPARLKNVAEPVPLLRAVCA